MNATEACIALNMLPTMGPVRLRKLLQVFERPERILESKRDQLRKVEGIGKEVVDQISNWESMVDLSARAEADQRFRCDGGHTVFGAISEAAARNSRAANCPLCLG